MKLFTNERGVLQMLVAVVKELKQGEGRVACTPENVRKLTDAGHKVIVEKNAGIGSGFSNDMYEKEGAKIVTHEQAWEADLVIKVKEPHESEYQYFKKNQIIWGFLHHIFKRNSRKNARSWCNCD